MSWWPEDDDNDVDDDEKDDDLINDGAVSGVASSPSFSSSDPLPPRCAAPSRQIVCPSAVERTIGVRHDEMWPGFRRGTWI